MKKINNKNFDKVLDNIKEQFKNGDKENRKWWIEELNYMLDNMVDNDFFGTEGQNDPRGDNRNTDSQDQNDELMELKIKVKELDDFRIKLSAAYKIALLENLTQSEKKTFAGKIDNSEVEDVEKIYKEVVKICVKRAEEIIKTNSND